MSKDKEIPAFLSTWSKFADPYSRPTFESFPELPECVTLVRFFVGVVYGFSLGYRDMTGGIGILMGASAVMFLPLIYVEQFLKAQVSNYPSNVAMAGVVQGMAAMVLVWVTIYTMMHEDLEKEIVLHSASIPEESTVVEPSIITEDKEF